MACICVVGMHRSGTSCLTGIMQRMGIELGEVFTENEFNKKGNRIRIFDGACILLYPWQMLHEQATVTSILGPHNFQAASASRRVYRCSRRTTLLATTMCP